MKLLCWDMPLAERLTPTSLGRSKEHYIEVLKDPRVAVMIFFHSACLGTVLAMNNTHFRTYFQKKVSEASPTLCADG